MILDAAVHDREIAGLVGDAAHARSMAEVEAALARAEAALGIIPAEAGPAISAAALSMTADAEVIQSADRVILPGVGAARHAMQCLKEAGLVETIYKAHISDRTQWQKMLKAEESLIDLQAERDRLAEEVRSDVEALQAEHGIQAVQLVEDGEVTRLQYPVQQYPTKVVALNLDKQPEIEGQLQGIKGQYLILDTGVINLRKYTSYRIAFHAGEAEPESGVTGDLFA